jgi:hypothetical protein
MNFIDSGKFIDYWMESGSSSLIREFFPERNVDPEQFQGLPVGISFASSPGEIDTTTPAGFLYQAGYLTLRKTSADTYCLDYPNTEVRASVSRLFMQSLFRSPDDADVSVILLRDGLRDGNAAAVAGCVYRMFAGICYDDVTSMARSARGNGESQFASSLHERLGEFFYRAILSACLKGA